MSLHLVVFYAPIALGVLLVLSAVLGLVGHEPDGDLGADADGDADGDADADASILSLLGAGHAPLGVLLTSASFLFGVAGLAIDALFGSLPLSIGVALSTAALGTGAVARAFGRLVPSKETYASRKTDLLGRSGVAELKTDASFGIANVRDEGGARIQIRCRTLDERAIERGEPVIVADYDEETDTFLVTHDET